VRLGPDHVRNGWLHFTQFKGRERKPITLDIPIVDELQGIIDASPCGEETFLLNGFGRSFTANGFGNWFHDRCVEAGVPGRAHRLRKAAATRLAELGCSEHEITSKEVLRYTKAPKGTRGCGDVAPKTSVGNQGDFPTRVHVRNWWEENAT